MAAPTQGFPHGLLRRSKRARLDYFAAYTIGHAIIVEALDAVLHAITQPIDTWPPVILVIGPAGVGKTTLIRAVERELTRRLSREIAANPGRLPSVSIASDVPESGSFNWKEFCLLGLDAMNEPLVAQKVYLPPLEPMTADVPSVLTSRTPATALRRALVTALIHRAPAAFLIDEAQQMAMIAGSRKLQHQMDYIKRLADATRVPPVLVGNYGLCLLRNQSAQLGRRTREIHVRRYDATRPHHATDFQDIVLSFQYHLPLAKQPDLIADWEYLYLRSVGCIGLLKQWLPGTLWVSLDRAVEVGVATITRADLERTAPPPSKSKKVLEEALDGEAKLAELDPEADPRAAEAELRSLLRLAPVPPPPSVATRSPANAHRRRPGERKPVRDPVGPEGVEVAG